MYIGGLRIRYCFHILDDSLVESPNNWVDKSMKDFHLTPDIQHWLHTVKADKDSEEQLAQVFQLNGTRIMQSFTGDMLSSNKNMYQAKTTKQRRRKQGLTYELTSNEWISGESRRAATDWVVVHYFAASSHATRGWARIPTLLVAACLILTTL
ncbi:hypothetical protein ANN_21357 [Periplaneta americana]|uniref:Uncharacterized protein n=1 Tax=Periplaneta americana TaxID=6978 RepID=A0ABQ8SGY2_PERAM|nr:hypothetical protein ANN_21357 [Periplaneta americana]